MNINLKTIIRSVILLFGVICISTNNSNAQVFFDSVYQDYIDVYKKVREYDMSFTEAMPITSSKTFILQNEHLPLALKEYRKKFPNYREQDLLVELSADVSVKFLNEHVFTLECKDGYKNNKTYIKAYSEYMCQCLNEKSKSVDAYDWLSYKDSVIKFCATSFIKSIKDNDLKSNLNKLTTEGKLSLQECAKVQSYIKCELLTANVIGACINRAERYYYFEKGLKMNAVVKYINTLVKGDTVKSVEPHFKSRDAVSTYDAVIFETKDVVEGIDVLTYEIQDWDKIYSVFYKENGDDAIVLFGVQYSFVSNNSAQFSIVDMDYMSLEMMNKNKLIKENIKRLIATPIMGGSK